MSVHGDTKLERFQEAGAAIIGAVASAATPKPIEMLQHVFAVAHDADSHRVQTNLVQQVWSGLVEPGQLSIRVNGGDAIRLLIEAQKVKNEQTAATQRLLAMLDELREMDAELAALREKGEEAWESFSARHGNEDEILAKFFTDEERQGLETSEDIKRALVEKYLNPDGTLKPEGEGLFTEQDIEDLRAWQRVFDKEHAMQAYAQKIEEQGFPMTEDQREYVSSVVKGSSERDAAIMGKATVGSEVEEVIYEASIEDTENIPSAGGITLPM